MCRLVQRFYTASDGTRHRYEDERVFCSKARRPNMCSQVERREQEYHAGPAASPQDTSSDLSMGPPTPTGGTGGYRVERREPAGILRRPSTKEGTTRTIKPQIIIEFGGKKGKDKKYVDSKRSSLSGRSIASSNEVNIDTRGTNSPIRTGFPEIAPPATAIPYTTVTAMPSHHRHTSSSSSFTTSSQPPSLYATSEPDSPGLGRRIRRQDTVVHNPPAANAPPPRAASPPRTRPAAQTRPSYRIVTPETSNDNVAYNGFSDISVPSAYSNAGSSKASSSRAAAPEITDRDADRARLRQLNADVEKKKQMEKSDLDKAIAEELARLAIQEEEARLAKAEVDRYKSRANERNETRLAESEKRRAEERENIRREKNKLREEKEAQEAKERRREEREAREMKERKEKAIKKDRQRMDEDVSRRKVQADDDSSRRRKMADEDAARRKKQDDEASRRRKEDDEASRRKKLADDAAKARADPRKEKDRPPTREMPTTATRKSRRVSVSQETSQRERERERALLLAENEAQMLREREATEAREAAERNNILWQQQQQQQQHYFDPRHSDQLPVANAGPGVARRGSVSARRNSITAPDMPAGGLAKTGRRVSVHQPAPPAHLGIGTSIEPTNYSMRGPNMSGSGTLSTAKPYQPPPTTHHAVFDEPYEVYSPPAYNTQITHPSARYSPPPTQPMYSPPIAQAPYSQPQPQTSYVQPRPQAAYPPAQPQVSYAPLQPISYPPPQPQATYPQTQTQTSYSTRDSRPQAQSRQPSHAEQLPTLRRRGEQVISQAEANERARQATHGLKKVVGFEDDYDSSEDEWAHKRAAAGKRRG